MKRTKRLPTPFPATYHEPTIVSVTFRTFCRRIRKHLPSATRDESYLEWCRVAMLNPEDHAARIVKKRSYVECPKCSEPWSKENRPAKCPECGRDGCTYCVTNMENGTCCLTPE